MGSLWIRIALRLGALFVLLAIVLVALAQWEAARALLFGIEGMIAVAALALVGAAVLLQPLLLRLEAIAAALPDGPGDELARIAARLAALDAQASAQAEALLGADRARRALIANVSHDLRTPLAAIQGYLELLLLRQDALEAAEARSYLQTAVAQCERLTRLVGDLFELSRLEGDGVRPQTEPFPLAELAHDVVQKHAPAAQRRDVRLDAQCADGALVEADIALIARVLDNLVDNALRHTPPGGSVTLEVGAEPERTRLSVCDTGEGIAAERLPGLLDHYERASRSAAGGDGRPGLGLAIAGRIVALHGSRLQIDSRRGVGTRVSFELARARPRRAGPSADTRT